VAIKDKFIEAIAYFNHANIPGNYDAVRPFLANQCHICRVNHGQNDINTPLKGTPDDVVDALNTTQSQKGIWPTLQYDPAALVVNANNTVKGTGLYTDGVQGVQTVVVDFEYHFVNDLIDRVNITKKMAPPGNYTLGPNPY
jgi:hypothetical protein